MNILSQLFGIFRRQGLVEALRKDETLTGFTLAAIIISILGGALYGFSMGIGIDIETAIKDAAKIALIATLGLFISIPIFLVAYRLLGQLQRPSQVAAVPLTLVATVAIVFMVTAPVVLMLSILTGYRPEAVYIHVIIVNIAILVGLYLAGMLIYHGFSEHKGLVIPNVVGFLMMGVVLVVLMSFLGPFLEPSRTFSVGTDRFLTGLGIGVEKTVDQALLAAADAERISYSFQRTNQHGDLVQDYTVTHLGDDAKVEIHTHSAPGEVALSDANVWLLDGMYFVDFEGERVDRANTEDLASIIAPSFPPLVFSLPSEFAEASWRALESNDRFTATCTTPDRQQAQFVLNSDTRRLIELTIGSAERGVRAQTTVKDLLASSLTRSALESDLNRAILLGSVDRSDASMQDYIQEETFFVVRYPRLWSARTWSSSKRQIELNDENVTADRSKTLLVTVYDLTAEKGPRQYAEELARSLGLQDEYREISSGISLIGDHEVGMVEYFHDRTVKGELVTTHHVEYIFVGQLFRYHLDFYSLVDGFENHRDLFESIAAQFTYLKTDLWEGLG